MWPSVARESSLTFHCWLPISRRQAFEFLSDARHLERLTPPWFRLLPLTPLPVEMEIGRTIDYLLRWRRLPLRWRSRVTAWDPPRRFTYEQEHGPYRLFRHDHLYRARNGGTAVVEEVSFAAPGGWLMHKLLVEPELRRIFTFRQQVLERLFDREGGSGPALGHDELVSQAIDASRLVVRRGRIEGPFETDARRRGEALAPEEPEEVEVVPGHLGP